MTKLSYFRAKKTNGKTLFALLDEFHFPGVERSLFIRSIDSPADSTIEAKIYDLAYFLEMMSLMGLDVDEIISCGKLPSKEQINLYIQASKFTAEQSKNFVAVRTKRAKNVSALLVSDKQLDQLMHSSNNNILKTVGVASFNRRIAQEYIKFVFRYHIRRPTDQQTNDLRDILTQLKVSKCRSSKVRDNASALQKPLTDVQFEKLIEVIKPDSPLNPFKASKLRNFLIVWMFITTGLRRSSVAKMKISDFDFSGDCNKLFIKRTPNDPTDSRKRGAAQKTREHIVTLPSELMLDLKKYYEYSRERFDAASNHEFIFVAEKSGEVHMSGVPLSLNSYNKILQKLSKILGFHIYPHRLRHHWNKIFDDIAEANGLEHAEKEKIRIESMGWTRNSKMGQLYARITIVKRMAEVNMRHQKEMYDAGK